MQMSRRMSEALSVSDHNEWSVECEWSIHQSKTGTSMFVRRNEKKITTIRRKNEPLSVWVWGIHTSSTKNCTKVFSNRHQTEIFQSYMNYSLLLFHEVNRNRNNDRRMHKYRKIDVCFTHSCGEITILKTKDQEHYPSPSYPKRPNDGRAAGRAANNLPPPTIPFSQISFLTSRRAWTSSLDNDSGGCNPRVMVEVRCCCCCWRCRGRFAGSLSLTTTRYWSTPYTTTRYGY